MSPSGDAIAIVGMQGRFPGSEDIDGYWANLAEGVESITSLSKEDVRAAGVPDHVSGLPGYVNASPMLGDVDLFDAEFFGFSARDAALTDPQHRLFMETAWQVLEDAGYDPARHDGPIGVFGGCELSTYLYQLSQNPDALGYIDGMQLMVTNDKDHLCTQVSYRLDLRGPSVVVQTTCSTSLVAVALACESLRAGRCDMALAGGVTVRVPQQGGYFYVAGSILSPDGHCRPFDSNAQGTIVGSGVGLVALKRYEDAVADRDHIRAVILGVGINNDGHDKVGYTAPGVRGQVAAIEAAYESAGVSPASVGYVEAHGTGTILGDPIEVSALTEVFRQHTDQRGFCGIGSVKSNFGHLSCASGVAGLMKTVLTLEQGAIPPTLHYRSPNPAIDFASSPFYVTDRLHPWDRNGSPRRAAVSSFGVGGTNAHAVLEEAPAPATSRIARDSVVLTISARTEESLDEVTTRLGERLATHEEIDLADAAHTLHVGRRAFRHRRSLVVDRQDRAGAADRLSKPASVPAREAGGAANVVFMFPGQGAQYPGMAGDLYRSESVVRETVDECCEILLPHLGLDLRDLLLPGPERAETAAAELRDTAMAQPALFVVEYALAQMWERWGVRPTAMVGHSVGEFVAATLAGVMGLEDALRLLALRGRLISDLPAGSMLSVMAPPQDVGDLLDGEVALAAVNAPGFCVLSGPTPAIEEVSARLEGRGVPARRLHTSHAFHSSMMDPILEEFAGVVGTVELRPPAMPYVSTQTGGWAGEESTTPEYWSAQLRSTVRFEDALRTLFDPAGADRAALFGRDAVVVLEVGPGRTLGTFAEHTTGRMGGPDDAAGAARAVPVLATLPMAEESAPGIDVALGSLGEMWAHGVEVDWDGFHAGESLRRVSLPTTPFERESYWIGAPVRTADHVPAEPRDVTDWFWSPVWTNGSGAGDPRRSIDDAPVLVMDEGRGLGAAVADALRVRGARPFVVRRGDGYSRTGDTTFQVDPADLDSYDRMAREVCSEGRLAGVVDCWAAEAPGSTDLETGAFVYFRSALQLGRALGARTTVRPLPVVMAARGTDLVLDGDPVDPPRAFSAGAARVLPQEHPGFVVTHVDVDDHPSVPELLVAELTTETPEPDVALRQGSRYLRTYEQTPLRASDSNGGLPDDPVVLVTGGLGHMGLSLAEALFREAGARLALVTRSALPHPDRWSVAAEDPDADLRTRDVLTRLAALHDERPEVEVIAADLEDLEQTRAAVDAVYERFGRLDVVVHGAANVGPSAFGPMAETTESVIANQLSPKLRCVYHLLEATSGREPTRWVLHSSISSVLGGLGLAAYAGANAVLDSLAARGGPEWLSICWDAWDNAAEAQMAGVPLAIQPAEGQSAFMRALTSPTGSRVIAAVGDLNTRVDQWVRGTQPTSSGSAERHPRPNLSTPYAAPTTETEEVLAGIWASQLGLEEVGIHDRFFDLGGHSLLAVQVASEIRDRFQIELPVLELFNAPTVAELSAIVDAGGVPDQAATCDEPGAGAGDGGGDSTSTGAGSAASASPPVDEAGPGGAAKASYREFYDDVTRRLAATGMGEASFFLNYGYVADGEADEAVEDVPEGVPNRNSIRLALELIGTTDLAGVSALDVGCGRGGTAALLDERGADTAGVDLSPEAIAFCRSAHTGVRFEVGDAENLPFEDDSFDVVTNLESSHTYPDMRAFLTEVTRVLRPGGRFLHTDLLAGQRWMEVQAILAAMGFVTESNREITRNVLASCDEVAESRTGAFGARDATIDNFLAIPGSPVYEQMASGAWEYRIVRSRLER